MSLIRTSRAGFAGWPLDSILPRSQARAACARVLKNLAAQSHLSIRTEVMNLFSYTGSYNNACRELIGAGMDVHLIVGTHELFPHVFAVPSSKDANGQEVGAVRGVLTSVFSVIERGATHIGVATR